MPEWLWAILIGSVVLGLIGLIWRAQERRIEKLEEWIEEKEKFDYKFRHDEFAPAIAGINRTLLPLVPKTDEHERRLNRLDSKVFNGSK